MTYLGCVCRFVAALALIATAGASPALASTINLGSDYFQTVSPSFFIVPNGYPNAGQNIPVNGLPIGPGATDTIVQRQQNCVLSLFTLGSSCTIPIEMVALSLVGANDPTLRFREDGPAHSSGMMTMVSDGSGTGGTFSSFFDIFVDLSVDGGNTFFPFDLNPGTPAIDPLHLTSTGAHWTTIPTGLLVGGPTGDQNANTHQPGTAADVVACAAADCRDFYLLGGGVVTETDVLAQHTAQGTPAVPEPASVLLVGVGLLGVGMRRWRQCKGFRSRNT